MLLAATFLTTLTLGGMVLHLVVHAADTTGHGGPGEYIPLAVLLVSSGPERLSLVDSFYNSFASRPARSKCGSQAG